MKMIVVLFKFAESDDDAHFLALEQNILFWKTGLKLSKFLFKLSNLIMVSFGSGKLVKIPENSSAMQSVLLINNTQ